MNVYRVGRCLLCGHADIDVKSNGRFVTTMCPSCQAIVVVEFDPPDEPEVRARIERVDDPN